jgi:6-phosphofructokinase 1
VALSVLQAGILARDMQKVDRFSVYQSIGRDAGWLAAAAYAAKKEEADPPHIILIPEVPFNEENFFKQFEYSLQKFRYVSIVCGEGIAYADGKPVSASNVKDPFSNIEFGAMGGTSAALVLHRMIRNQYEFRGEFQIPESLAMCAADRAVTHDIEEAFRLGQSAVLNAAHGVSGLMTTLVRQSDQPYRVEIGTIPLNEVAAKTKPIPREWIAEQGLMVNEKFGEYIRPLVGPMPEYAKLGYYSII